MAHGVDGYEVVVTVPVAWGDMDALGHVNNTVFFRWFESARIAYLEAIGMLGDGPVGPILASTECRFRRPVHYPDTVRIGARTVSLDEDRFAMEYVVISAALDDAAARGRGVVVAYDYEAGEPTAVPAAVRARIRELDGI